MRSRVAKLLVMIGLLDFSGFAVEFFAVQDATNAALSGAHEHSDEKDCGNSETECARHCHFGHCSILFPSSSLAPSPLALLSLANGDDTLESGAYLFGLFRPPIA